MELQVPSEYDKMREQAMLTLIYAGVRVPTQKQISVYLLTGEIKKELEK